MKLFRVARFLPLVLVGAFLLPTSAQALTITSSSGSLSASADFEIVGGNLQVTLTNTSSADVLDPTQVLTALFFDLQGVGALTPVSALLPGGTTVFFGPDGGGNVGGEWEYLSGLAGAPGGATEGISSSGFGLFGNFNFNGTNLDGPDAIDGLQYGITSAGDNSLTGNAAVTGGNELIKNSVVFTLSGLPQNFQLTLENLIHVSFQYGTALTDACIGICGGGGDGQTPVPEPASLVLLGTGLAFTASRLRRKRA